jgi:K+-transporting ATPase ATPase B chain
MEHKKKHRILFDARIIQRALIDSLVKLNPLNMVRNPVMFVVEVGSILTMFLFIRSLFVHGTESPWFILHISIWLWATVLFANFAESVAEGRGKAQAEALRSSRKEIQAKKLLQPERDSKMTLSSSQLRKVISF